MFRLKHIRHPNAAAAWPPHLKEKHKKASPFCTSQHWPKRVPTRSCKGPAWWRASDRLCCLLSQSPRSPLLPSARWLAGAHRWKSFPPFPATFCRSRDAGEALCVQTVGPPLHSHSSLLNLPAPKLNAFLHRRIWQNCRSTVTSSWCAGTNLKLPFGGWNARVVCFYSVILPDVLRGESGHLAHPQTGLWFFFSST